VKRDLNAEFSPQIDTKDQFYAVSLSIGVMDVDLVAS
jgi:hypothetical protein